MASKLYAAGNVNGLVFLDLSMFATGRMRQKAVILLRPKVAQKKITGRCLIFGSKENQDLLRWPNATNGDKNPDRNKEAPGMIGIEPAAGIPVFDCLLLPVLAPDDPGRGGPT